jgi:hypothetical protein
MNNYTWDCRTVDTYPTHSDSQEPVNTQSDVIYNVHWRVTGSDGTHQSTVIGTQVLSTDDLSSFTSFDELSHDDVVSWVKSSMGSEEVDRIEETLDKQISELANPTSVTKFIQDVAIEGNTEEPELD